MARSESQDMDKVIDALDELEKSDDYDSARKVMDERNKRREELRSYLMRKIELPNGSENYAGNHETRGGVPYKELSEYLRDRLKMSLQEYEDLKEQLRKPRRKIRYGKKKDINSKKREKLDQIEFDFVTGL